MFCSWEDLTITAEERETSDLHHSSEKEPQTKPIPYQEVISGCGLSLYTAYRKGIGK